MAENFIFTMQDLRKVKNGKDILKGIYLSFFPGAKIGVIGPNGAGKSTLLNILATLLRPSAGKVLYGTHASETAGDVLRASIGVLGHDLYLYPDLTAAENLAFFGRLYGVPDLDARVAECLTLARLTDRADDRSGGFSRGLRQRLALERALIHRPRLVLLDEPFTGLDDASAHILIARLRTLAADGAIVIMATHDFDTAETLVDDAVCIDRGRAFPIVAGSGSLRDRYRLALQETR